MKSITVPLLNALSFFILFNLFVDYYHNHIKFAIYNAKLSPDNSQVLQFNATIYPYKKEIFYVLMLLSFTIPFTVFATNELFFGRNSDTDDDSDSDSDTDDDNDLKEPLLNV